MPVPIEKLTVGIVNAAAKKALDVGAAPGGSGVLVVQDPPDGAPGSQQWQLVPAVVDPGEDPEYLIRNVTSGKVLDNTAAADKKPRQSAADGGEGQRWRIIPVDGEADLYRIECTSGGEVLDLAEPLDTDEPPDTGDGQVVLREYDDTAEGQRWRFVPGEPERTSDPVLRWSPVTHWNGRQSWQLGRSTALRPTVDAAPSFSDMRLVCGRFGYDADAGGWKSDAVARRSWAEPGWKAEAEPRFPADLSGEGPAHIVAFKVGKGIVASRGRGDGTFVDGERVLHALASPGSEDFWSFSDTTGDGRLDLVGFCDDGVRVSLQTEDGQFAPAGGGPVLPAFGAGTTAGEWSAEKHPRFLVDTTGDGRVDVVGFHDDGVWVSLQDEDGRFAPVGDEPVLPAFGHGEEAGEWRVDKHPRFLVDTTGDGRVDVVGFHDDGVWVSLQDEDGNFSEPTLVLEDFATGQGWRSADNHPRFLAETTDGGNVDIVGFGPQGVVIARGQGDGSFGAAELVLDDFGGAQGWTSKKHLRLLVDITGDGRVDVVGFGDEGVWVSRGLGSGEFERAQLVCKGFGHNTDAGGWRVDKHLRYLADVTGDGRVDIVGFGGPGVYVARNLVRRFMTR